MPCHEPILWTAQCAPWCTAGHNGRRWHSSSNEDAGRVARLLARHLARHHLDQEVPVRIVAAEPWISPR
jgi:hypothetical protein